MIAVPFVALLLVFCGYYFSVAKNNGKNPIKFSLLAIFIAILPFLLFVLFISIAHLILGHDPKFKIPKPVVLWGALLYAGFMLMLPQMLKRKWKKEEGLG